MSKSLKTLAEVSVKSDGTRISLSKLVAKVVDVEGYVAEEFGSPTFILSAIVLDNGYRILLGGEHDMPFIDDDVISEEQMQLFLDEEDAEESVEGSEREDDDE